MAENSSIRWIDHTFNPWIGCTKVSDGCKFCYAEEDMDHRRHKAKWGPDGVGTRTLASEDYWNQPLKWNRKAQHTGMRLNVFCLSLADVFEDWSGPMQRMKQLEKDGQFVPLNMNICPLSPHPFQWCVERHAAEGSRPLTMNDVRTRLFALIDETPWINWLLVTKRPEHIRRFWVPRAIEHESTEVPMHYRSNVWLLTFVENQESADTRIPELLNCRDLAPVLGLSCEPLLGPVSLCPEIRDGQFSNHQGINVDWVICGGESGYGARPMHPDWARSLRDQCQDAGVPFHFKQWGEWSEDAGQVNMNGRDPWPHTWIDTLGTEFGGAGINRIRMRRFGKKNTGRLLDGHEWNEMPFPKAVL